MSSSAVSASGRCLTPSPDNATIQNCGGQRWSTTDTGRITINGQCLDAKGAATANGTPVITYACNNGANQRWTVGTDGTIRGVQSGRCLDVKGEATGAGTAVQLYDCHGRSNQRWELVGGTTPPTTPPPGGGPDLTSFGLLRNYAASAPARAAPSPNLSTNFNPYGIAGTTARLTTAYTLVWRNVAPIETVASTNTVGEGHPDFDLARRLRYVHARVASIGPGRPGGSTTTWVNDPNAATFPSVFSVDSLRIWVKCPTGTPANPVTTCHPTNG